MKGTMSLSPLLVLMAPSRLLMMVAMVMLMAVVFLSVIVLIRAFFPGARTA